LLFSAGHVLEFLRLAAARAVEERWTPLDFVKASRLYNQVEESMDSHLLNLVSQFEHQDDVADVAAPLVASSFLLNHYVPDMHGTCTLKLRPVVSCQWSSASGLLPVVCGQWPAASGL
jgi:hypothetical protein